MRERINHVTETLTRGQVPIGLIAQIGSADLVEIIGAAGFDHVWIDCEHGSFGLERCVEMCRAADAVGITPVVRVPSHDPVLIMQALDAGAMGVVVPHVETRAETEAIVAAAKFRTSTEAGSRGACPGTRATWHQAPDWARFVRWSNDATMVWLIVETLEGVSNFPEIVQVRGVDAVAFGTFDLAQDMGHDGDTRHPEVVELVQDLRRQAAAAGVNVVANLVSTDPAQVAADAQAQVAAGATILSLGSDRRLIVNALKSSLVGARSLELDLPMRAAAPATMERRVAR